MFSRQGRPQRGDGMGKSCLVERDRVEIAFDDDHGLGPHDRLARLIEGKQGLALLKQQGIGRIEVLGHAVVQYTSTESHHTLAQIGDREHEPSMEFVVIPITVLSRASEPSCHDLAMRESISRKEFKQPIPFRGRHSNLERIHCRLLDTSFVQILTSRGTDLQITQIGLKPRHRGPVDFFNAMALPALHSFRRRLFHRNAHLVSKLPQHFRKGRPSNFGQKGEDISPSLTAEAVKHLFGRTDRERRALLLMKRAQPYKVLPRPPQRDVVPDDIRDIYPISYSILDIVGNQASAHQSRSSYAPVVHDRTSRLISNRNN